MKRPSVDFLPTRRAVSGGLAAAAAMCVRPSPLLAETPMTDFTDPNTAMKALAKLRGALDESLVTWWLKGVLYAVVDQEPVKLWGLEVVSFNRWRQLDDATYMFNHYELSVKVDPATGAPIDSFVNPYTDETVPERNDILGPSVLIVSAESGRLPVDRGPKATQITHHVGDVATLGDRLWVGQELYATVPPREVGGAPWKARDISTYMGTISAIADDGVASAPAETVYQGFYDWRPWMKMGATEGFLMARLAGRKLASADDIPESYTTLANAIEPAFLAEADSKVVLP